MKKFFKKIDAFVEEKVGKKAKLLIYAFVGIVIIAEIASALI